MLSSITPLGERGRHNRFGPTAAVYVVGSLLSGTALGSALGALGGALHLALGTAPSTTVAALVALAVVAALGLGFDLAAGGRHLPTVHHQVNERWLDEYRWWVYAAGFGAQLGLGVVTIVTASAVYLAFATAFLTGAWTGGLIVGGVFGLARALPLLSTARVHDPHGLVRYHRALARLAVPARNTALALQGAVVLVAVGLALTL